MSDPSTPSGSSTPEPLPVATLREAAMHLRRPFTPEAVRFKVQTVFNNASGCMIVAYIDARLVIERLNLVIPDKWTATYQRIDGADKFMWCHLKVDGVMRSDVGESTKGMSKDLVSDALKRAAVQFGIGVSVYALPQITLFPDTRGLLHQRTVFDRKANKEKPTLLLTEQGHVKLREGYARWLENHGIAKFGTPLDHGDVKGPVFDEEMEHSLTEGVGDGSAPGWQGVSLTHAATVEALVERAERLGLEKHADLAMWQMKLNDRDDEYVDRYIAERATEIDKFEKDMAAQDAENNEAIDVMEQVGRAAG